MRGRIEKKREKKGRRRRRRARSEERMVTIGAHMRYKIPFDMSH